MSNDKNIIKGRGTQNHSHNVFHQENYVREFEEGLDLEEEIAASTQLIEVFPKSIVNRVDSPDLGLNYSMNPYQGCEHGCIYCYARNSHMNWGYNPGIDFESKLLYKPKAAQLLEKFFNKRSWDASPIMLSGNTDCYQPIERKLKISRSIIEVFSRYKNPLGIITKNYLVCRDIDLLSEMSKDDLVHVFISITSLNEELRRVMEPRTSSSKMRLKAVEELSKANIPVGVMMAPIIPGLNSHEIPMIAKSAANAGARTMRHTVVRLNGSIAPLFKNWLEKHFPNHYQKVIHQIESMHGGNLNDSDFSRRIKGDGRISEMIKQMVKQSGSRYFKGKDIPQLNRELFRRPGESLRIPGF